MFVLVIKKIRREIKEGRGERKKKRGGSRRKWSLEIGVGIVG